MKEKYGAAKIKDNQNENRESREMKENPHSDEYLIEQKDSPGLDISTPAPTPQ